MKGWFCSIALLVLVALAGLWIALHRSNAALRATLKHAQAEAVQQRVLTTDPVEPPEETSAGFPGEPEVPDLDDGPITVPGSVEELAEVISEGVGRISDTGNSDVIYFMRTAPVITAGLQVHAEALATPEGSGKLIGEIIAAHIGLDAGDKDEVIGIVTGTRRAASESFLLSGRPADENEQAAWEEQREALQLDARERVRQVLRSPVSEAKDQFLKRWNVLHGVADIGQLLGSY